MKPKTALPMDIRLMNLATWTLAVGLLMAVLAGGAWWLMRLPQFNIRAIVVEGEISRNNAVTLRANVMPKLSGNFFTLDLQNARQAFESVPWVRMAVVHRDFPNQLRVIMTEHQPAALWVSPSGNTLLNPQGDIFEANYEDVDQDALPRLKGPDDQSAAVLHMHRELTPMLRKFDMGIDLLELSPRGSWRIKTDSDAEIELGRGTEEEVKARLQHFLDSLTQVTARFGRRPSSLASADLRHKDGYALRLRGVGTIDPANPQKPKAPTRH